MKVLHIQTDSSSSTLAFGKKIGEKASKGMVILLQGDLGAGKTTLTQGIAIGLNITRNVTSPTFNILKIYNGRMPLYHIDAYRMEGLKQDLGLDEFLEEDEDEGEDADDLELVAIVSAAIAASTGSSTDDFVVRSIKRRY